MKQGDKFGKEKPYLGYWNYDEHKEWVEMCQIHHIMMLFHKIKLVCFCPLCLEEVTAKKFA